MKGTKQKLKVMARRKFTKNGSLGMEVGFASGGVSQELKDNKLCANWDLSSSSGYG